MKTKTLEVLLVASVMFATASLKAGVSAGPVTNSANGHVYYLLTQNTWGSSEAEAVSLGGHLATVNDEAENNWILNAFSRFGGSPKTLWIGLNDVRQAGTFEWADGTSSPYRNWSGGEPNNIGGERYVHIYDLDRGFFAGSWNNIADSTSEFGVPLHGVVETVPLLPDILILGTRKYLRREFRVNSGTFDVNQRASLARLSTGKFIVTWHEGSPTDCYGRVFDSKGNPTGSIFLLHPSISSGTQYGPSAAGLPNGGLFVAWGGASSYVDAQRFDSNLVPMGGEISVAHLNAWPAVAAHSNGEIVVVLGSQDSPISARRFDAAGIPSGPFQAGAFVSGVYHPSVAYGPEGRFTVAWPAAGNIRARTYFSNEFSPMGPEFQINSTNATQCFNPSIAYSSNNELLVAWSGSGSGDTSGVFLRRFDASGVGFGSELLVNEITNGSQSVPNLSVGPANEIFVAWQSGSDVFGRLFDASGATLGRAFKVNKATNGTQQLTYYAGLHGSLTLDNTNLVLGWSGDGASGRGIYLTTLQFLYDAEIRITSQPDSVEIAKGSTATFAVGASSGESLSYQWQFNLRYIPGATNAMLILTNVQNSQAGSYQVVMTNSLASITSAPVSLTISLPPTITVQPESRIVAAGTTVSLNVAATGTGPLSYQWQLNGTNLPNDIITTVAGRPNLGDGGTATRAGVHRPYGVTVDAGGTIYVADTYDNRVRRIGTNGLIATIAGDGSWYQDHDGSAATNSSVAQPNSVAVDVFGNVFINETWRIRKVDTNGVITAFAGDGYSRFAGDGGAATNASLAQAWGIVLDQAGNMWITDWSLHRIRKVGTNGIITTVAGNDTAGYSGDGGLAVNATLNYPSGAALDAAGNFYFADQSNHRVRKISTDGIIMTVAGNGRRGFSGDAGFAASSQLNSPHGVAVDLAGNLFIADWGNNRIRKVNPNGIIMTIAGNGARGRFGDGGSATNASFDGPRGLAVDSLGNVLIADEGNNRIRQVSTNGVITTLAGAWLGDGGLATDADLADPYAVAVDIAGNLFIADAGNHSIRRVDTNGLISTVAGNGTLGFSVDGGMATNASLFYPREVTIDNSGNLLIGDTGSYRVRKVDLAGQISTVVGSGSFGFAGDGGFATNSSLSSPNGVTVDDTGKIYIADTFNQRIRVVNALGMINTLAGNGTSAFSGDSGAATLASFSSPNGIDTDLFGNLFVADSNNQRIRKITPNGIISTFAGNGSIGFSGDGGAAPSARLWGPVAVSTDRNANVYISEYARVRKVDSQGIISTLVGNGKYAFSGDGGPARNASIASPQKLSVDSAGNLLIADPATFTIRKVWLAGSPLLTLRKVTIQDAGEYRVIVRNAAGAVTSRVATLTVGLPPAIVQHPESRTVGLGGQAAFVCTATGSDPLSYRWLYENIPLSGATNSTLTLSNVQLTTAGNYSAWIQNSFGGITSSVAQLVVLLTSTVTNTTARGHGADAYVQASSPNDNFGSSESILVKTDSGGLGNSRKGYFRFDLASFSAILAARLELSYVGNSDAPANPSRYNVFGLRDGHPEENWNEHSITWNNAPANSKGSASGVINQDTQFLGTFDLNFSSVSVGDSVSLSSDALVSFLQNDNDGVVTLIVTRQQPNFSVQSFASKENISFAGPRLIITTGRTQWDLHLAASPASGGTLTGAGTYDHGTYAIVRAEPAVGARFLYWEGDGITNTNADQTSVLMDTNRTVTAHFTAPDLLVTNIIIPSNAVAGQIVRASWTLLNKGTAAAIASWADRVWLSQDNQVGDDSNVALLPIVASVFTDGSLTRVQNIVVPAELHGNYWLVVQANADQGVAESSFSNNFAISERPIFLTLPPCPNLQVATVFASSNVFAGQETVVEWVVTNAGPASTTSAQWHDAVYLSVDTKYDAEDQLLCRAANVSALVPGGIYFSSCNVRIPARIQGPRYLIVRTDYQNRVDEGGLDRDNIGVSRVVQLDLGRYPDLQVTNVRGPFEGFSGQPMTLTWAVTNAGSGPTEESVWYDTVFFSTNNFFSPSGALASVLHSGALLAGSAYTVTQQVTLPVGISGTNFHFFVQTDSRNEAWEYVFENNNVGSSTRATDVHLTPPPDLELCAVVVPSVAHAGADFSFTYCVTNRGSTETPNFSWQDAFYLSSDTNLNVQTDTYLGTTTHNGQLQRNQGYTANLTLRVPGTVNGLRYLIAMIDGQNSVFELNKSNNRAASPAVVSILGLADLQPVALSAPTNALAGFDFTVTYRVTNSGPCPTVGSAWTDSFYISTDQTLDIALDTRIGDANHSGVLAIGGAYQGVATLHVPIGVTGDYYLFVVTDRQSALPEQNEGNNAFVSATPIHLQLASNDLSIAGIGLPSDAVAGSNFTLTYVVTNRGLHSIPNTSWSDAIYLTDDGTLSNSISLTPDTIHTGSMLAGANYTNAVTYRIPDGVEGSFRLLVFTDADGEVFEQNETNNYALSTTSMRVTNIPPDLVVTDCGAGSSAIAGSGIQVNWTVRNIGSGRTTVDSWRERIVLSPSMTLGNAGDVPLGEFTRTSALGSTEFYSRSEIATIPRSTAAGTYFVFVEVDSRGEVYERSNDSNNSCVAGTVRVIRPDVDLVASGISAAAEAFSGQPLSLTWTVRNTGNTAASGNGWQDYVYLSRTPDIDTNSLLVCAFPHTEPLAPNASYTISKTCVLPWDISGDYYIVVHTDGGDDITESVENNNGVATVFPTYVYLSPTPDLILTGITAPEEALSGQPVTISWSVLNFGAATLERWYDSVFLSLDTVFDRSSDIFLGYVEHVGGLDESIGYTVEHDFDLPPGLAGSFYVFVVTDSRNRVYERGGEENNVAHSSIPMVLSQPPLPDFVVTSVTPPAGQLLVGAISTISYNVLNQSLNPVNGRWDDTLYLSSDRTWDINDTFLARVNVNRNVGAWASYEETVNARIPGVVPGSYYVIIRSDIRNQIAETDEGNNVGVSSGTVALDMIEIPIGGSRSNQLFTGTEQYYKVHTLPGETLAITLDSSAADGSHELFTRFDEVPTRAQWDFAGTIPFSPDQKVIVPETKDGDYLNLVRGQNAPILPEAYTIAATLVPFGIESIRPSRIGDNGQITITITGADFRDGATVKLIGSVSALIPFSVNVLNDTVIKARFHLTAAPHGEYACIVTSPNGSSITSTNALLVENSTSMRVRVETAGNLSPRAGQSQRTDAILINEGNIDAEKIVVSGKFTPFRELQLDLASPASGSFLLLPESSCSTCSQTINENLFSESNFIVADLAPQESVAFSITASKAPIGHFGYLVSALPYSHEFFDQVLNSAAEAVRLSLLQDSLSNLPPSVQSFITSQDTWQKFVFEMLESQGIRVSPTRQRFPPPRIKSLSSNETESECLERCSHDFVKCTKKAGEDFVECLAVCFLTPDDSPELCIFRCSAKLAIDIVTCSAKYLSCISGCQGNSPPPDDFPGHPPNPQYPPGDQNLCPLPGMPGFPIPMPGNPPLPHIPGIPAIRVSLGPTMSESNIGASGGGSSACGSGQRAVDPNEMIGPDGYGNARFVRPERPLLYSVYFENIAAAPAAAADIRIVSKISPTVDPRSVRLKDINFGRYRISVPSDRSFFQTRVAVGSTNGNLLADINAFVDVQAREIRWTLRAIDPATGELVQSVHLGLLPPNDATHRGEGFVSYTVQPREGLSTGTIITNTATIIFDNNEPVDTAPAWNTLDTAAPTSAAATLPGVVLPMFQISWSGSDDDNGSGLHSFDVFASDDGGPFELWLSDTTENSAVYAGVPGHSYTFYSRARDNVGNLESAPAKFDAETRVTTNSAPVLLPIRDQTISAGENLLLTNLLSTASGPVAWRLLPGAPLGARINITNGIFNFIPECRQGSSTNPITVVVSDREISSLSSTQAFRVVVPECVELGLGTTATRAGQPGCIPIDLFSTVDLTNLSFTVTFPFNRFSGFTVTADAPLGSTSAVFNETATNALIRISPPAGQRFNGPLRVGSLCFDTTAGLPSAFIPMATANVAGQKPDGTVVANAFGLSGRVVIVADRPLLEAILSTNLQREAILYAPPPITNTLQFVTHITDANWLDLSDIVQTNLVQRLLAIPTNEAIYLRTKQK